MTSTAKKTIQEFGYEFNDEGKLRQLNEDGSVSDRPFKFDISPSHATNQKNYEALGEAITDYVYELMEKEGLHKLYMPDDEEEATFVFSTQKELRNVGKLMIIIHGSGVVRAGQWAR